MKEIFEMFDGDWANLIAQADLHYSAHLEDKKIKSWILRAEF